MSLQFIIVGWNTKLVKKDEEPKQESEQEQPKAEEGDDAPKQEEGSDAAAADRTRAKRRS